MRRAGWLLPYAQTHPPFVIRLSFQPSTATDIPTEPRTSRDVYSLSKRYRKMMSEQPQEVARERVERPVKSFRALKKPILGRQRTDTCQRLQNGRQMTWRGLIRQAGCLLAHSAAQLSRRSPRS